jgi:hypothetical protein
VLCFVLLLINFFAHRDHFPFGGAGYLAQYRPSGGAHCGTCFSLFVNKQAKAFSTAISTTTLCQFWHTMNVVPEKPEQPRKLVWLVDSLARLTGFPPAVRQKLGFALYQAQIGQKHESAKMLHGFAETVWQVRADD